MISRQPSKKLRGFTLIEIIVVVALIGVVSLYLYQGYQEEIHTRKVRAIVLTGQDMLNAANMESYSVTNPDVSNYNYNLPLASNTTFGSIGGRAVKTTTVFEGMQHSGTAFTSAYDFNRTSGLLNIEVEVPGVGFAFHGVQEVTSDFGVVDATDDMTTLTLYPRSQSHSLVDLTAISRHVKSEYYWQLRK